MYNSYDGFTALLFVRVDRVNVIHDDNRIRGIEPGCPLLPACVPVHRPDDWYQQHSREQDERHSQAEAGAVYFKLYIVVVSRRGAVHAGEVVERRLTGCQRSRGKLGAEKSRNRPIILE